MAVRSGWKRFLRIKILLFAGMFGLLISGFAQEVKKPNVAGAFYPADSQELSKSIDAYVLEAAPDFSAGDIFALISPHAGYGYSGKTAAFGYKLIKEQPYKTVIVIAPSHAYGFAGVSIWPSGVFRTPLGDIPVDEVFASQLILKGSDFVFDAKAFAEEHALEVQLPFLQKTLTDFKIVPIVIGDLSLADCGRFADMLKTAIGERRDCLVIASSDMAHRYDYEEVFKTDALTLEYVRKMDFENLYYGFRDKKVEMCGVLPVVVTLGIAKKLGYTKIKVLAYTNSAEVTGVKKKGTWTVGYTSCVVYREAPRVAAKTDVVSVGKGEKGMFNSQQRRTLLEIARNAIKVYLETGKKTSITPEDPLLSKELGAFVTLQENSALRGCIGNIIGRGPLYATIRDMAVEAAVGDPRFAPARLEELKGIHIEISVLSPMERVDSPDKIILGTHGVLVRSGAHSGVFLPQVATETGWSKEEFLSNLCSAKAGLSSQAWKDKSTELYVFTAEVFSEEIVHE